MGLPIHKTFTEEHRRIYGPFRAKVDEFATRIRSYQTPFMYDNVQVGDIEELDAMKGVEFKADTGFITITEDRPIAAVTVVGSGCVPRGCNIVEWWDEGETMENVDNRTLKRLRVDNLNGIHPSVWIHLLTRLKFLEKYNYDIVSPGDIKDHFDLLKKLSLDFSENLPLAFHENCAHFAVGHSPVVTDPRKYEELGHSFATVEGRLPGLSYPKTITIRCGCKEPENPGTKLERYPGDYAIRLVRTHVIV